MTVAVGLMSLAAGPVASAQQYLFNRVNFATGNTPTAVVATDLNGDGIPDIAAANKNDGTVSVLIARNNANFKAQVTYPAGSEPVAIAAGDFNGDKKTDLVIVNLGSNTVSVLLGNGDGTFQTQITTATGNQPDGIVVGDFNGDGILDVAVSNSADNTVSILLGNGTGGFTLKQTVTVGHGPAGLAAGDVNGDGTLDLAVANTTDNTVSVLTGKGDGTFTLKGSAAVTGGPTSVAISDFNGDGKLDLAVANNGINSQGSPSNSVSILLGNGDGSFQNRVDYATGMAPLCVTAADFNADGKPDLAVTANGQNTISILAGNGDGSFQPAQQYGTDAAPAGLALADFNGDGRLDLVAVNSGTNTVSILLGNGDLTFEVRKNAATAMEPTAVATGDFNGDGKLDMAVVDTNCSNPPCPSGMVSVLLGNGDGTFGAPTTYNVGTFPLGIVAADMNNDHILDLVVVNQFNNTISVLLGKGDGTFGTPLPTTTGNTPSSLVVGDFNKDGFLDVATANNNDNTVSVLLGNGTGGFPTRTDYATGLYPFGITAADLNGDGSLDLAVANQSGTVSVLLNSGTGTFTTHTEYTTGFDSVAVSAKDFNKDNHIDLAVANAGAGTISVLLNNGDGTFKPQVSYDTDGVPVSLITQDINRDGKPDLTVAQSTGSASVLLGNGDGTFQAHLDYAAGTLPAGVTAADFTGSGANDLAVTNAGDNTVSVLLNTAAVAISPTALNFGSQASGVTSQPINVTLTNPTGQPLTISTITASAPYAATNTCGTSLGADANCTISVTFTPASPGTMAGTLTLTDGAPTSPQVVSLTGLGTGSGPAVELSSTSINFGDEPVGKTSSPQTVTVTNSGTSTLTISNVAASGDFAQTSTCITSLAPNATCTITVTFTPTVEGARSGAVTLTDNAADSPQTIGLSGFGTGSTPSATLSPTSLTFALQVVGTKSPAQPVTLTNGGNAALSITSIATSGDFGQTNNCGTSLAAGANCTINVTFTPTGFNGRTGTLTVTDSAANSPQTASLRGTGTFVELSATIVNFGTHLIGTTTPPKTITLTNVNTSALTITSIALSGTNAGDFKESNTCGSSVPAGGSCTISVTFKATVPNNESAQVAITDNGGGSPQIVQLIGGGTYLNIVPTTLNFGSQQVGTTSAVMTVKLTDTESTPVQINSITITGAMSGDFKQTNNCPASLFTGANCTINVTFTPTAKGSRKASISIADTAGSSPQAVSLSGTGT
ncbi:MAG TPA: FG-GAP-like repeat-containing protein [Terriglobia bacterium]|nr:FG-GAP-like repeat-containing protein [Terriglobia bacterium]